MTKCDFCSCYNPRTRTCSSYTGSYSCDQAARAYLSFMKGKRTQTKNVNVHKTTKKYGGYKKR